MEKNENQLQTIWFGNPRKEDLQWMYKETLGSHLKIEITEIGPDFIRGTMPVDAHTKQPFGICHGGAFVAMAEELGSIASYLCVNPEFFVGLGMEINANHLKAARSGFITGTCRPIHLEGKTHVWEIRMEDEQGTLCSISRFTCQIVTRKSMGLPTFVVEK